jgi:hypothetical protein
MSVSNRRSSFNSGLGASIQANKQAQKSHATVPLRPLRRLYTEFVKKRVAKAIFSNGQIETALCEQVHRLYVDTCTCTYPP